MNDKALREHLVWLLNEGNAHLTFDQAIADLPVEFRGRKAKGVSHTVWRLIEHIRLCQWDILEFCISPNYVAPKFPDDYWPQGDSPPTDEAWDLCIETFHEDLQAMTNLVTDPNIDLFAKIPWGDGQTILREAMLIADHNAYHLGQIVFLRRCLGAWDDEKTSVAI